MTRAELLTALEDAKLALVLAEPAKAKAVGAVLDWAKAQLPDADELKGKDIHIAGHVSAEPTDLATCRSCKADIAWVLTPKGEKQPIDAQLVRAGVLDNAGKKIIAVVAGYQSHFITCPDAAKWSGKNRKAKPDHRSEGE